MKPSEDGPCVDCEPMDSVVVVMLGLLVMLSLLGIHFLNDKRNRGTMTVSILLVGIVMAMLVQIVQQMGALGMLSIP